MIVIALFASAVAAAPPPPTTLVRSAQMGVRVQVIATCVASVNQAACRGPAGAAALSRRFEAGGVGPLAGPPRLTFDY